MILPQLNNVGNKKDQKIEEECSNGIIKKNMQLHAIYREIRNMRLPSVILNYQSTNLRHVGASTSQKRKSGGRRRFKTTKNNF
jgi:hypothetical protein